MQQQRSVDISGLDKTALLRALWSNRQPALFFSQHLCAPPAFDEAEAARAVARYIDYFCGRRIKADLRGDAVDPALHDRDVAGDAKTMAAVVDGLRQGPVGIRL